MNCQKLLRRKLESARLSAGWAKTETLEGQRAASLEKALEARHDGRPTMTRGLQGRALCLEIVVGQDKLHDGAHRVKFEGNPRSPFAAVFIADLHVKRVGKQPRRLRLQHLALPVDSAVVPNVSDWRAGFPVGLNSPATPISSSEFAIRQRLPQVLGRCGDVGDINELRLIHLFLFLRLIYFYPLRDPS